MPTISSFYGILIRMFFFDTDRHRVPHIHAEFQGLFAVYAIHDGRLLAGRIPAAKQRLVRQWIAMHREELLADWALTSTGQRPFPIRGLDQ